uniref:Aspartyl/glutamyl-tRNA(Asn/Gln) amidotransferase subunit C n=1 Tax=Lygus hesperus TaxID=30085 RepID=A0A0A9YJK4_LYGHE
MKNAYDEEMECAAPARARIRQERSENKFHRKRGTGKRGTIAKEVQEKAAISLHRRVHDAEGRTGTEMERLEEELDDLTEQCKMLKSRLDNSRSMSNAKVIELNNTLHEVENDGAEVRAVKTRLLKEQEELTSLKTDLQEVLHYVRKLNKMELDDI